MSAREGSVVSIHLAGAAGGAMRAVESVRAVAGRGLEGDRYFLGTGTYSNRSEPAREITLIELEAVEALSREKGLVLAAGDSRRNVVTRNVALNHLVGRRFRVGSVVLEGIRLCEPCSHLEGLTTKGVMAGLIHRGGLRARILEDGVLRVGDPVGEA